MLAKLRIAEEDTGVPLAVNHSYPGAGLPSVEQFTCNGELSLIITFFKPVKVGISISRKQENLTIRKFISI